jgi:EAL and modified HD-GYP domain-containing signal transduction protein
MPDTADTNPQDVFLCRQPILDRQQQLFAYALPFRGTGVVDTILEDTFSETSLPEALGPYQGFIEVGPDRLFDDRIDTLPSQSVVLEILDSVAQTPKTIARCESLRQAGYILAIHVRAESPDIDENPLSTLAEFIKVDTRRTAPERLEQLAAALKPWRKTLLAEKVESHETMRLCHEFGFDLFQGYYFARPMVTTAAEDKKPLQSSKTALLRLLGLIRQEAGIAEIEAVFKQEPALTIRLLRLTNSAGSGLTTRITSLHHAITLLGRRQLLRWLQLLLYSGASNSASAVNPLLQLAATRGRLMELLVDHTPEAKQHGRDLIDQAFMVGILSLMPIMLGAEFEEVLAQLPLATPVLDALGEHRGRLGELLGLVEALEEETPDQAAAILPHLPGIDSLYINACLAHALGWANNLAR